MAYASRPTCQVDLTRYKRGKPLGKGSFGIIYIYEQITIAEYAKIAVKELVCLDDKAKREIDNEIDILSKLSKLKHPNIVRYLGHSLVESHFLIILEYMQGGSITGRLKEGKFSEKITRKYTRDILEGLQYLHSQKIIHRDIKGGNVLLDRVDTAKLADFGISKELNECTATSGGHTCAGTTKFMAPEVIVSEGATTPAYGRKSDIWSVGCVVVQMLTSRPPWEGCREHNIYNSLKSKEHPKYELPENTSEEARNFIKKCFTVNDWERPSADQLLDHEFFPPSFRKCTEGKITIDGEDFNIFFAPASDCRIIRKEEEYIETNINIEILADPERIPDILRMTVLAASIFPDLRDNLKAMQQDVAELIKFIGCAYLQCMNSIDDIIGSLECYFRLCFEGYEDFIEPKISAISEICEEIIKINEKINERVRITKDAVEMILTVALLAENRNGPYHTVLSVLIIVLLQQAKESRHFIEQIESYDQSKNKTFTLYRLMMSKPDEIKKNMMYSKPAKKEAIQLYSRWIATRRVLKRLQSVFERVQRDIDAVLSENPSVEEARERLPRLEAEMQAELPARQEELRKLSEAIEWENCLVFKWCTTHDN